MCPEPSNGVLHADGADATSTQDFVKIDEQGSHPAAESRGFTLSYSIEMGSILHC